VPISQLVLSSFSSASGGILLMWDRRVVEKIEVCGGEYVVACSFRNVEDDSTWAFEGVYGPNIDTRRRSLWDELTGLLSWWDLPWCIGGDFNVTHFPCERSGVAHLSLAMTKFSDFISEQGLMDLPLAGGRSRGPIILHGQGLIGFLFLLLGKLNILGSSIRGFLVCALITFLSSLSVAVSKRGKDLLSLRICGRRKGFVDRVRLLWAS
jgi:hypothetical protein